MKRIVVVLMAGIFALPSIALAGDEAPEGAGVKVGDAVVLRRRRVDANGNPVGTDGTTAPTGAPATVTRVADETVPPALAADADEAGPAAPPAEAPPAVDPAPAAPPAACEPPSAPAPTGPAAGPTTGQGVRAGDAVVIRRRRVDANGNPIGPGVATPTAAPTSAPGMAPPAPGPVVGLPAPAPQDEPPASDDLLRSASERAEIERQRQEVLLNSALQQARDAMQRADVEDAITWYEKALQIDPTNAEARRQLTSLTSGRGSVGEFLDQQRSVEVVRREQAAAEVRAYLDRGRAFEAQGNFDGAVKEYQKALAIVSWYTDQSTFGVSADRVRDLIENARYKAETSARVERQNQIRQAQMERERELMAERERQLGTMRAYFEQAHAAFRRGEYALAREYAKQIQRLDPQNCDAERLIAISYDAEHLHNVEEARRQFDDQWKAVMKDLEFSTLPQTQTVVFPDDWLDGIAQRAARVVGEEMPAEDASFAQILTTLETKRVKGLTWQQADLDQVIAYLRTITGLNFFVTPTVRAEKFDEVVVDLELDDVSVKTVLDLVTEPFELKWEPRNGVVTIATKDEIRGDMLIRYFDVKDLNVAIQNFVGQEINLVPSNFVPPEPPELPEPAPIFPIDDLVELIRETIGDEGTWEDPATIEPRNGIIIARNTPQVLGQVEKLLDELRRNSGLLVNLEVRFLTAEDNFLRDVGVDVRGLGDDSQGVGVPGLGTDAPMDDVFFGSNANPYGVPFGQYPEPSSVGTSNDSGIFYNDGADGAYQARVENLFDILLGRSETLTNSGGLSFQHVFLDDTEIEVILRAVQKSERIQQVTASRITVYNNQRANVSVLNQVSYVQDYEVEIAQASNIANPVIQTIQDGVVLDVRPVISADRRFVTLELRPTVALLTRPIATFSTSLASGPVTASAPVVIQIPELRVSRVRTTVVMPDRGTLLLGGLKFYEQVNQDVGVPFLSNIPILKFLWSREATYTNRRNLIILITAEIVALSELEPKGELDVGPVPDSLWTPLRPYDDLSTPSAGGEDCGCPPPPACDPCANGRRPAPPPLPNAGPPVVTSSGR